MLDATADEIFNTLLLERAQDSRLAVVVEGPEDFFLINMHAEPSALKLLPAYGKPAALGVAKLAQKEGVDWVIVAVDADFDALKGGTRTPDGCAQTRYYDLTIEAILTDPGVLRAAVAGLSTPEAHSRIQASYGSSASTRILEVATVVGGMRYLVEVERLFDFSTRDWRPRGIFRAKSPTAHVAEQGARRSGGRVSSREIFNALTSLPQAAGPDSYLLICGHDVVDLVLDLLHENGAKPSRAAIEAAIRGGVRCDAFLTLTPIRAISAWSASRGIEAWTCSAA